MDIIQRAKMGTVTGLEVIQRVAENQRKIKATEKEMTQLKSQMRQEKAKKEAGSYVTRLKKEAEGFVMLLEHMLNEGHEINDNLLHEADTAVILYEREVGNTDLDERLKKVFDTHNERLENRF